MEGGIKMTGRITSEAGNEKEAEYGRNNRPENKTENVIESRSENKTENIAENRSGNKTKNKGENKTGEFIARKRKERGLTQREMADQLGVTNKAVSKWETGQGMPDIGILSELGKVLGVTADEILTGEQIEQIKRTDSDVSDEDKKLLDIVLERAERKAETIQITWKDILGCLLFLGAAGLISVQVWTLVRGRELGLEYIMKVIPYVINAAAVFFLWAGGMCIGKLRPIWKRKSSVAAAVILFVGGIAVCPFLFPSQREVVDLAPDFSNVMRLKIDENGRAVFYRQRGLLFGVQADVFPFTVKDDVKVQWLENDVCALTYESPEDDQVHQFVATYGDRNEAVSYYYVANVAYGTWMPEDRGENYKLEVGTGENGGIDIETPEGKEHYEPEECLQYGTLAVVFPSDDPKWTLVLNKDCVVEAGGSRIEEGGTVTLCKVAMEKTAPIIMH